MKAKEYGHLSKRGEPEPTTPTAKGGLLTTLAANHAGPPCNAFFGLEYNVDNQFIKLHFKHA